MSRRHEKDSVSDWQTVRGNFQVIADFSHLVGGEDSVCPKVTPFSPPRVYFTSVTTP